MDSAHMDVSGRARFVSQWLDPGYALPSDESGSPLDRNVFLALIVMGVLVLARRKVDWTTLVVRNRWVWLFVAFFRGQRLLADDSVLALKRWIKGSGNLVMAFIIVTERRPYDALGYVLRRLFFCPASFIGSLHQVLPRSGRQYHMGLPMHSGAH
jgi:hypothetical protein